MENPTCSLDPVSSQTQDNQLALHLASPFLVLVTSLVGTCMPIVFHRLFSLDSLIFQSGKIFGAGVLLGTAYIHMQTSAFVILSNPCLPSIFQTYPAFPSLIALFGMVVFNQMISQMTSESSMVGHVEIPSAPACDVFHPLLANNVTDNTSSGNCSQDHAINSMTRNNLESGDILIMESNHVHGSALILHSDKVGAYLLEVGVASHSLFIGIALGTVQNATFLTLLIAIIFHQFFEGIAVSSVVLEAGFENRRQILFMILAFSLMTPIGMAIGLALSGNIHENATQSLIAQGVLDALASGILVYDGMTNVVLPHFNGKTYLNASRLAQFVHFFSLWLGAAVMSLIGVWI